MLWQHKLSFVMQLNKVEYTKKIFDYLNTFYDQQPVPTDSFFSMLRKIREKLSLDENERKKSVINKKLNEYFKFVNDGFGLIDSVKTVLCTFGKYMNNNERLLLLSGLLAVLPVEH